MTPKKTRIVHEHPKKSSGNMGRRAFMNLSLDLGLASVVSVFAGLATVFGVSVRDLVNSKEGETKLRKEDVETREQVRKAMLAEEERRRHQEQLAALRQLFGFDGRRASLVPAADHPFKPLSGPYWYPIDSACALAYKRAVYPDLALAQVNSIALDAYPQDSLVMFGSQVSNAEVRSIFGDLQKESVPHFEIVPGKLGSGWQASLRWNLYCSESMKRSKPLEILIPGIEGVWEEDKRVILDAKNKQQYSATGKPQLISDMQVDALVEDFLLVTVLPRNWNIYGQKIISFAGLYGPGMEGAELLFSASADELKRLQEATEREPFYQALYRVVVKPDENGRLVPQSLQLQEAAPLYQTPKKGGGVILSAR